MKRDDFLTEVMAQFTPGCLTFILATSPQEAKRELINRAKLRGITEEDARKIPMYATGRRFNLVEITEASAGNLV